MFKNTGRIYFKVITMLFAQAGKIKQYFLFVSFCLWLFKL